MAKPSKVTQLDFFQPTADEINANRIEDVFQRLERVRKGTYAQMGEINKRLMKLEELLEHLTRHICKGD